MPSDWDRLLDIVPKKPIILHDISQFFIKWGDEIPDNLLNPVRLSTNYSVAMLVGMATELSTYREYRRLWKRI